VKNKITEINMKNKKLNDSKLTPTEIVEFKALLLTKRNEILGNVLSMEEESLRRQRSDLSNMPIHMADAGSDNYEIENTLGLMDSERKLLREIDEALDRIEEGTYGTCEGSGKLIPKARLEAIPWAKYDDDQDDDPRGTFRRTAG
jgi:RNA polymerase-binding transcription factor DksA